MGRIAVGRKVPDFSLEQSDGTRWRLADHAERKIVLYFYPKDMTAGCTTESRDFRDLHGKFTKAGALIVGISRDSVASHAKFRAKEELPFELLADVDEKVCRLFDVIREKTLYGRKYMGIERSTFLLGPGAVLATEWRKVRVAGHAQQVLEAARALEAG